MKNVPDNLKYSDSHEWVRVEENGEVTLGITHHAQQLLGELVFVELPHVGDTLEAGQDCAVVESVKAASDVYSPLAGDVVAVNDNLTSQPNLVNDNPYDGGWLIRLQVRDVNSSLASMMSADGYKKLIDAAEG